MFTGIVERLGSVVRATRGPGRLRLAIDAGSIGTETSVGESVAVDGACLTVAREKAAPSSSILEFDVVRETLSRTTLGDLRVSHLVNLERSLRLSDLVGGHLVTGHVDAVGEIRAMRTQPGQAWLTVEVPTELRPHLLYKGSIALCGVSLTIAEVVGKRFSVALVPHTLAVTKLSHLRRGDRVNLETDLIGKWVRRLLEESGDLSSPKVRRSRTARR